MSIRTATGTGSVLALLLAAGVHAADVKTGPGLGQHITAEQAASWDLNVYPDGQGLPLGSGSVAEGEKLFHERCEVCHGPGGVGASADELAGGDAPLDSEVPDKTIGTYWPYATSLFDFIRRAMPMNAPFSLKDNEVYAVTAYLLHINHVIPADAILDQGNLAAVKMPNRDGFYPVYPIPD